MSNYISDENNNEHHMNHRKTYKSRDYLSDEDQKAPQRQYNSNSSNHQNTNYLKPRNGTRTTSMNNPTYRAPHQQRSQIGSSQERQTEIGKTIRLLRNGDPFYRGHKFVISTRRYRYFDVFMDDISDTLNANFGAIRKIYTTDGQLLENLESFEDGQIYVAAGSEKFIRMNYIEISEGKRQPPHRLPSLTNSLNSFNVSQYDPNNSLVINVFRNGDILTPAYKILLYKNALVSFEAILNEIASKVKLMNGPILKLYKMNGETVYMPHQLENGFNYVAASREKFKNVEYNIGQDVVKTSVNKSRTSRDLPPVKKHHQNQSQPIRSNQKTKVVFDNRNDDIFKLKQSPETNANDNHSDHTITNGNHSNREDTAENDRSSSQRRKEEPPETYRLPRQEEDELQNNYQNIVDDEFSDVNSTSFSEIKSESEIRS